VTETILRLGSDLVIFLGILCSLYGPANAQQQVDPRIFASACNIFKDEQQKLEIDAAMEQARIIIVTSDAAANAAKQAKWLDDERSWLVWWSDQQEAEIKDLEKKYEPK
jgi:hypothetical protein